MDYEKKYRDLVEAVKELQEANPHDEGIQKWIEDNIPELKESEDERIRQRIIHALHGDVLEMSEVKEAIDWLEKQGEQKSAGWSEEDERLYECLIEDQEEALDKVNNEKSGHSEIISDLVEMYRERIVWFKDLKDRVQSQTTWKPSEEQIGALEHFVRSITESGFASPYDSNTKLVYSLFNDLKKLRENSV